MYSYGNCGRDVFSNLSSNTSEEESSRTYEDVCTTTVAHVWKFCRQLFSKTYHSPLWTNQQVQLPTLHPIMSVFGASTSQDKNGGCFGMQTRNQCSRHPRSCPHRSCRSAGSCWNLRRLRGTVEHHHIDDIFHVHVGTRHIEIRVHHISQVARCSCQLSNSLHLKGALYTLLLPRLMSTVTTSREKTEPPRSTSKEDKCAMKKLTGEKVFEIPYQRCAASPKLNYKHVKSILYCPCLEFVEIETHMNSHRDTNREVIRSHNVW